MEPRTRSTRSSLGGVAGAGSPVDHRVRALEPSGPTGGQPAAGPRRQTTHAQLDASLLDPALTVAATRGTIPSSPIKILGFQPRPSSSTSSSSLSSRPLSRSLRTIHPHPHTLPSTTNGQQPQQHSSQVEPLAFVPYTAPPGAHPAQSTAQSPAPPPHPSQPQPTSASLDTSPLNPHSSSSATQHPPLEPLASSSTAPPRSGKMSKSSSSGSKRAKSGAPAGGASSTGGGGGAKKKSDVEESTSGFAQAGDLDLEFKTVDGAQMVLGKEGKWFDFNPGPNGTGMKDGEVVFECFMCDKIYLGVHARSIWRRHLKDKHKIPLSLQPRRTRWDGREDKVEAEDKAAPKKKKVSTSKRPESKSKKSSAGMSSASSAGGGPYGTTDDDSQDEPGSESEIESLMPAASGSRARSRTSSGGKGKGKGKGRARPVSPPATIVEEFDVQRSSSRSPDYNSPEHPTFHHHHYHHGLHPEQQYYYPQQPAYPPPHQAHVQQQYSHPQQQYDAYYQQQQQGGYPPVNYPPPPAMNHLSAYASSSIQAQYHNPQQQYAMPYSQSQEQTPQQYSYGYSSPFAADGGSTSYARDDPHHQPGLDGAEGAPYYGSALDAPHGRTIYRRSSFPSLHHHPHLSADISPARSASAAPDSPSRPHNVKRYRPIEDEGDAANLLIQLKQSSPLKPSAEDEMMRRDDDDDGDDEVDDRRMGSPGRESEEKPSLLPPHGLLPAPEIDSGSSRRSRSVSRGRVHSAHPPSPPSVKDESLDPASYNLSGSDVILRTHLTRSPAFPHPSSPFRPPDSSPVIGRHGSQSRDSIARDAFVTPYGKYAARRTSFRPSAEAGQDADSVDGQTEHRIKQDSSDDRQLISSALQPSSPAFMTDSPQVQGEDEGSSSRRRDAPLVPLFAQPQIPQKRSITATTPLISSLTRTTLPAWHPTPLKSSSTMTALDYTPVVSSTRTPFKSSSGSKSATEVEDRLAPLKSIRYTPGAFGVGGSSTPHEPSLSNGSSPPQSSLSVLSSPQSLGLTRSLGLAPATPGGQWDSTFGTPEGSDGNLLIGSLKKRRGSWAVGTSNLSGVKERAKKKLRTLDGGGVDAGALHAEGSGFREETTTTNATAGPSNSAETTPKATSAAEALIVKDTVKRSPIQA